MGFINPAIGLGISGALNAIFGLWFIIGASGLLSSYGVDVTTLTNLDKVWIVSSMQALGVLFMLSYGINQITIRTGTDDQKATLSLLMGVAVILCQIIGFIGFKQVWEPLGSKPTAVYITIAIYLVVGILCLLGANYPPASKMAPLSKPTYWGFIVVIVLFVINMLWTMFSPEGYLDQAGVEMTPGKAHDVIVGLTKYNFNQMYLSLILQCVSQIVTFSPHSTYVIGRLFALVMFAFFIMNAVILGVFQSINAAGKLDKAIASMWSQIVVSFGLTLLFYIPLVLIDPQLKESVEGAIEGTGKATKKKDVPAPAPAKAPEEPAALPEVAPLLPPLASSGLIPSYSMVATNQRFPATTAYASPYAMPYAAPATTAYAAPATTSYMQPMGTATYAAPATYAVPAARPA